MRWLTAPLHLLVVLAAASPTLAGTLYVDAAQTTGANNGSSWANAFQGPGGLSRALAAATSHQQMIWVAEGTYLPSLSGDRSRSFELSLALLLYGGFAGGETSLGQRDPALNETILSGDLTGDDATGSFGENSYHVVRIAARFAALDGFTITGGNANGPGEDSGGGVVIEAGNVGLRSCVIRGNRARILGGGVVVGDNLYAYPQDFDRCVFEKNVAVTGSAIGLGFISQTFLQGCLIHDNTATGSAAAGAVYMNGFSQMRFSACTVVANVATSDGAAGLDGLGGATHADIESSIFYFNTGQGGAQGRWNQINTFEQTSHSCVQGGVDWPGNISSDPLMIDVAGGDFRLTPGSPCVDAGSAVVVSAYDLDRTARFEDVTSAPSSPPQQGPVMDMGAYETPGGLYELACPGDGTYAEECPCGNSGVDGRGCAHSTHSAGALLVASGRAQPDRVLLSASALPSSVACVVLQGDTRLAAGVQFGDGVRCIGGVLKRIATETASPGGDIRYPALGDPSVSARSAALGDPIAAGSERWYQVWYRDSEPSFCPEPQGGTSNVSSGIRVRW